MDPTPYRLLTSRRVYENPWIRLREDDVLGPHGSRARFAVVDMKAGSSVLALEDGHVYLVSEHKYAVGRATLEAVSGGIEEGETPLDAARRELREETGLSASQWVDMGSIDPFTTLISSPNHLFLALGLRHGERSPDAGELLRVERVPLPRALEMVAGGEITHAASVVLLLKAAAYLAAGPG